MPPAKLSDAEAKALLEKWPTRTKAWGVPPAGGFWIQAQPKPQGHRATTPRIRAAGSAALNTQPDGMWVYLRLGESAFADVIAVEVCGSIQNLNDKRSRYMPTSTSLVLHVPLDWLIEPIGVQRGGRNPRWEASGALTQAPKEALALPVRFLRVLYAIADRDYAAWTSQHVPAGHEYYCRHTDLKAYNNPKTQRFLKSMSASGHFLTQPG